MTKLLVAYGLLVLAVGCGAGAPRSQTVAAASTDSDREPAIGTRPSGKTPSAKGEQRLRFLIRVPQPGHVSVVEKRGFSRVEMTQRDQQGLDTVVQTIRERIKLRSTVLAANDRAVWKKRVEYLEWEHERRMGNQVERIPNPLIGKTYVVQFEGGAFRATNPAGDAVSEYEQERLQQDHPQLGKPSHFAALLPDRPIAVGARLEPEAARLAEAFGQRGVEVRDVLFTLTDSLSEARMVGTAVLEAATCWPVEVSLSGQVKIEGRPPNPTELRGTGEVKLQVVSSYSGHTR